MESRQKTIMNDAIKQCKDGEEQQIICPNCHEIHDVNFNPYYTEGRYTCSKCNFCTAVWQFDIVVKQK